MEALLVVLGWISFSVALAVTPPQTKLVQVPYDDFGYFKDAIQL